MFQHNDNKSSRIIVIPSINHATSDISLENDLGSIEVEVSEGNSYFLIPDRVHMAYEDTVFNFPFLLNKDGTSWQEANEYFFHRAVDIRNIGKETSMLRRDASRLLDYKLFCEENNIDYLDFTGRRASHRPTYKYFRYLIDYSGLSADNINQRTSVVYKFYKYLSGQAAYNIDITRVDTVKSANIYLTSARGHSFTKSVDKRSQTKKSSKLRSPVRVGYVRDGGEDLRPLSNKQFTQFMDVLQSDVFSVDERLICHIALFTGARKQSIFTLRMKHLELFKEEFLLPDGTYAIHAGFGSDIDTKYDKKQTLYFPKHLADRLIVYSNSAVARARRAKFRQNLFETRGGDETMPDEDIYVFLSDRGNCFYMAQSDFRFNNTKSRPIGQRTNSLKRKLIRYLPDDFPQDFSFHWLRATFAYLYYQHLLKLKDKGLLQLGEEVTRVQMRMHHSNRSTTENYLKLFLGINDVLKAQELYEEKIFSSYSSKLGDSSDG